jgi:hypothetical protein
MKVTLSSILAALAICASPVSAQKAQPFVFTPTNSAGPFPVVLWLHGYRGYSPSGYFPGAAALEMQKHADTLGAAIIGFPATIDLGDGRSNGLRIPPKITLTFRRDLKRLAKAQSWIYRR